MKQIEIVSLDWLVSSNHQYRSFMRVWDFKRIDKTLIAVRANNPKEGYENSFTDVFSCNSWKTWLI